MVSFWIVWKFPDCLESFQIVWKVSGLSRKLLGCLESFRFVWKVSGLSGKFPDCLESFQIVWKVSGLFRTINQNYQLKKNAAAEEGLYLFGKHRQRNIKQVLKRCHILLCRKSLIYVLFFRNFFIYALFCRPESFWALNSALRKVFDFSASGNKESMSLFNLIIWDVLTVKQGQVRDTIWANH